MESQDGVALDRFAQVFIVDLTENLKFLANAAIFGFRIDFHTQSNVIFININIIALIALLWLGKIFRYPWPRG